MNIIVLEPEEIGSRIPRADRRYEHVKKILKKGPGDRMAAGIACDADSIAAGAIGEATVLELDDSGMILDFQAFEGSRGTPPALAPLRLVLGFPRPIQAARILKDLTSLGVEEIHLTGTELGEKSYSQSSIFKDGDFRRSLIEGAEQAGNPRLPRVFAHRTLRRCLEDLADREASPRGLRIYLHPYGDLERMGALGRIEAPVTLAVGSERGWTDAEISALGAAAFVPRRLGERILKTETAALTASVLVLAGLGWI